MSLKRKYLISFANLKTEFIVTYYNNQFVSFAYKKGGMSKELMQAIGKVIPVYESTIKAKQKELEGRVKIEMIEDKKPKSQFTLFLNEYIIFYSGISEGVSPKIDGIEGGALKKIITHLSKQASTDEEAFQVWQQIFSSWKNLESFYQKQIQLKQINSNLNTIIIQLKNGKNNNSKKQAPSSESMATAFFNRYGNKSASE